MDSWTYLDSPVPEQNHSKPRLHPGEDLTALTMLYEQCKVNRSKQKYKKKIIITFQFYRAFLTLCNYYYYFPEPERAEECCLQSHRQHLQNREVRVIIQLFIEGAAVR